MSFPVEKALKVFQAECEWLSLRYVKEKTSRRAMRDARPESNHIGIDEGIMMEVVMNGHLSYAATSDLSDEGLRRCFEKGKRLALQSSKQKLMSFDPASRGKTQSRHNSPRKVPLDQASLQDILALQAETSEVLKRAPNVLSSSVALWLIEHTTHYVTSDGADLLQTFDMLSQGLGLTARKGDVIQTRTDGGFYARSHQIGAEGIKREEFLARAEKVSREVNELLDAEDCPTGEMDLLLMPNQMMLQIHESIGHPLELDRILGDERNYAGWSFVKPHDFGSLQYGSSLMNVCFDPHHSGEFASYAFDDAGQEAKKVYLIKEGKLLSGLGSSESQSRLGITGVSNYRASSWNRAPIDRMANINLEAGSSSFSQMISSIERGVLMDSNRSWSIDDYRNKFQFGCEYAQMIEDGKITKVLKNPNYRGITVPFWSNLKMVGDGATFETYGTPHCGKGEPNQAIRVGHASPAALFSKIEIFGGVS